MWINLRYHYACCHRSTATVNRSVGLSVCVLLYVRISMSSCSNNEEQARKVANHAQERARTSQVRHTGRPEAVIKITINHIGRLADSQLKLLK